MYEHLLYIVLSQNAHTQLPIGFYTPGTIVTYNICI